MYVRSSVCGTGIAKTPQQRRAVANVTITSVRQQITRVVQHVELCCCHSKVCSVISGLRRAAGRLFNGDSSATVSDSYT